MQLSFRLDALDFYGISLVRWSYAGVPGLALYSSSKKFVICFFVSCGSVIILSSSEMMLYSNSFFGLAFFLISHIVLGCSFALLLLCLPVFLLFSFLFLPGLYGSCPGFLGAWSWFFVLPHCLL